MDNDDHGSLSWRWQHRDTNKMLTMIVLASPLPSCWSDVGQVCPLLVSFWGVVSWTLSPNPSIRNKYYVLQLLRFLKTRSHVTVLNHITNHHHHYKPHQAIINHHYQYETPSKYHQTSLSNINHHTWSSLTSSLILSLTYESSRLPSWDCGQGSGVVVLISRNGLAALATRPWGHHWGNPRADCVAWGLGCDAQNNWWWSPMKMMSSDGLWWFMVITKKKNHFF